MAADKPVVVFHERQRLQFRLLHTLNSLFQGKGKGVTWHDRRNGASSIDLEGSDGKLMGIVLNVPVTRYAGLWKGRHWVAMPKIRGVWYNLDSELSEPYAFENVEDLREFLEHVVNDGAEVLFLVKDDVEWGDFINSFSSLVSQSLVLSFW